jgi:acetyltransferase-like isoleucine patch superfamily enzyme
MRGSLLRKIFVNFLVKFGFQNIDYYYVHGEGSGNQLHLSEGVSTLNATFNISSGNITVGSDTLFGHNVLILTGYHRFHNGVRAKLSSEAAPKEVPDHGEDITIGKGCMIGSNAIVLRGVHLGDNVIVGAGAVVTKSFSSGSVIMGKEANKKTAPVIHRK